MSQFSDKLVRKLFRDTEHPLTRNRHFLTFEDPIVKCARRISRHLASIESLLLEIDASELSAFSVTQEGEHMVIFWKIDTSERKASRKSFVSTTEWALLLEGDAFREHVDRLQALFQS